MRPRARRGHLLVTLLWAGVLGSSTRVELGHAAVTVALAVHVMGLVIGLGAVLLVDWYGLVWMAGLRTLSECLRLAQAAHPLIWLGSGLLLASGIGLAPDAPDPLRAPPPLAAEVTLMAAAVWFPPSRSGWT